MAVRTRLSWPWRAVIGAVLVAIVGGMWWWGFDFGQIFNRDELNAQLTSREAEARELRNEMAQLVARSSLLERELAMAKGSQATLSRQLTELQTENSQLKDELGFMKNLVADSNKQTGLTIQRLAAVRDRDDVFRFSMLVVRGGSTSTEFVGNLKLQAALLQPATDVGMPLKSLSLALPDEQPDVAGALELKFKYYQRVEGSFRAPPGAVLKSLTARAFEAGQAKPMATQNLNFP
jgi:uncharacterized protein YhaN